jgi:hypothetical protein
MPATPVDDHQGGVVGQHRTGHRQHRVSQGPDQFPRMQLGEQAEFGGQIQGCCLPFAHPVGDDDQLVPG